MFAFKNNHKDKLDYHFLNFIIKLLGLSLAVAAIFAVAKYIGLLAIISKVIQSLFPVFFAIVLSFLSEPIIAFLERRRFKRKFAVLICYGMELGILILIIIIIFPQLFTQLNHFFSTLPDIVNKFEEDIKTFFNNFGIGFDFNSGINNLLPRAIDVITTTLSTILNIMLAFGGALFLSFDFLKFKETVKKIIPKKYRKQSIEFFHEFLPFVHKYCFGMLIDASLLWLMTGIAMTIVGMPYAFMFGFIIAICDLIPIVGPYIGGAPALIVAMTISWRFTIVIFIIISVAQIIESNITQPFILKNVISLHPLEGIAGIAILGSLFGFFGLIASPIVVTALKIAIRQHKSRKESKKLKPKKV